MIGSVLLAVGPSNVNFVFAIRWPWRKTASLTVFSGALGKPVYVYVTPVQLTTTWALANAVDRFSRLNASATVPDSRILRASVLAFSWACAAGLFRSATLIR